MIEYCHVRLADRLDAPLEGVLAQMHDKTLFITRTYLDAFNQLGKDNWRMCGQATHTRFGDNDTSSKSEMFYFMREVE